MASVMFSAIGQAVGGPFGAGIGAMVGGSIDRALSGRGRRPVDFKIQGSSYGETVPRLFGTTRTAGQLIWALTPEGGEQGKGSGRGTTTTSFAIALSAGPILEIGRIWADSREIRNTSGDFETAIMMRIYRGRQLEPDMLITAQEGVGGTPAYAGLAYVVFENFPLAAFGNRIPNLTFEVVADAAGPAIWLGGCATRLGLEARVEEGEGGATGYASAEADFGEDLHVLSIAANMHCSVRNGAHVYVGHSLLHQIPQDDILRGDRASGGTTVQLSRSTRPQALSLDYLDPERDFQVARQRAVRSRSGQELESAMGLSMQASAARAMAERLLRQREAQAERMIVTLPWRWLHVEVGDLFRIGSEGPWRVVRRTIRHLLVELEGEKIESDSLARVYTADPGRALRTAMIPVPPTKLVVVEAPVPLSGDENSILLLAADAPGWRGADISLLAGGDETSLGRITQPMPYGALLAALAPGPEHVWDETNSLLVDVSGSSLAFESRSLDAVLAGSNLIHVGGELVQYREATLLTPSVVRLSGLLRGRFGTGWRMGRAPVGSGVIRVIPDQGLVLSMTKYQPGQTLRLLAGGWGDPVGGTEHEYQAEGVGWGEMAPVHVKAEHASDGTVIFAWQSRSRQNWNWIGADVTAPRFRWHFLGDEGFIASLLVTEQRLELSPARHMELFSRALSSGQFRIEALGEGPAEMRFSAYANF